MSAFSLFTTLCLAATFSLLSAETLTVCDDSTSVQRLSCDSGVISVQRALYGRADRVTCSDGRSPQQLANTQCSQEGTTELLRQRCDGKKVCELNSNVVRVSDPCYGISKYLQTNFTCVPAIHVIVCEGSYANLFCDVGQVISVHGAHYGRLDRSICSFQRQASQLQNVICSKAVSSVAESCDGRNSCSVKASNTEFGDPCFGTYKYLDLSYSCLYPA